MMVDSDYDAFMKSSPNVAGEDIDDSFKFLRIQELDEIQPLTSDPIESQGRYDQSALIMYSKKNSRHAIIPKSKRLKSDPFETISSSDDPPILLLNKSFAERLLKLQYQAMRRQYDLAYLNTMGGAYHLCAQPIRALEIARQQERLACQLGSVSLFYRARGFQAVNLGLLGHLPQARRYLKWLAADAEMRGYSDMAKMLQAMLDWMRMNYGSLRDTQSTSRVCIANVTFDEADVSSDTPGQSTENSTMTDVAETNSLQMQH